MNDPPIINMPLSGSKLKPLSPQNVIFQWTPRHTGSPNAAFSTEYDVKVVEVWPANRNPNDAILTQPSIYETTINSTTLIYGPEATQLEPGRTYAFRVQARAIAGADHFDLFKNNGYSETVTFIYGDACDAPINIIAEASTPTRISLQWDASPSQTGYTVQYRVKGQVDGHWYSNSSVISSTEIAGLQPGTTYEYQMMSTCGSFESQFGNIATIATPDLSQGGYTCGVPLENFNLDPSQLIPVLKVGEVIRTGDFDVTITKITGGNGVFSGAGDVVVPFLNQVRAHVIFDNITVNNDKRMVKGYMNVAGGGVEIVPAEVMARMDQLSQSLSVADSILGLARQYFAPPPDPSSFVPDQVINVPAGIKSVIKDPVSGNIIVVDNNGQTQTIPAGKNTAITDGKGNGVIVNQNGGKANVGDPQLASILKREYNLSLTFAKASNTNYGLDQKKLDQLKSNYEKLGDNYYVSWKAVSTQADPVVATYNGKDNIPDKIKFELDGAPATATANGNSFTINIAESASQMPSSIVAKATNGDKEQILGKLNVVGYDAKPMNLKIVKVNNAKFDVDPERIKYQLDTIYSKAVVSWNVEVVDQTLHASDVADPFDDGSSGLLSNYTGDMKAVINTYGDLQPDTYYLFLIDKAASTGTDKQKLGYMPRAKKAGFIITQPHNNDVVSIVNTMAHELGHGAFTLKHTFSEYTSLQQGTTDNLMDYNNGTNLWKYQWDRIHDPAVVLGLFEGDDAGANKKIPQGKPIVVLADSVVKKGDVVIYDGSESKFKLKFEIADTSKTKIGYQLLIMVESNGSSIIYPKVGTDSLVYNLVKEITLDSIPQGKYTLTCKSKNKEYKTNFFVRKKKLEVTASQLNKVFGTDSTLAAQVAKTLNKFGNSFGITTSGRMTHFLAQTGYESGGFKSAKGESACYPIDNPNWSIWFNKTWGEPPFGTDCDATLNAIVQYAKKLKWTAIACDTANKSCVSVPTEYVCSALNPLKGDALAKKFFSYVYQCEGGNGKSSDEDGYKYRGHGAIQLTWKKNYQGFDAWLQKNYKELYKNVVETPTAIDDSKELFVLSAMWFWGVNKLNDNADNDEFDKITKTINNAKEGRSERLKNLNNLKEVIK